MIIMRFPFRRDPDKNKVGQHISQERRGLAAVGPVHSREDQEVLRGRLQNLHFHQPEGHSGGQHSEIPSLRILNLQIKKVQPGAFRLKIQQICSRIGVPMQVAVVSRAVLTGSHSRSLSPSARATTASRTLVCGLGWRKRITTALRWTEGIACTSATQLDARLPRYCPISSRPRFLSSEQKSGPLMC